MRYAESLRYLNSFLNLERILYYPDNRLWNLDRMHLLLDWFNHPEKDFFPVLIAGTKGKGSTGFFLESILVAAGQTAGFYSSPHLEDPRERIRLNGRMISESNWCRGVRFIQNGLKGRKLRPSLGAFTYFEIMTLLAILIFQRAGIKIGIFEVGMGGRLDATNALEPRLAVLTPIHLDHEAVLGNTIAKIAREKAAIIREGADVVVSPQPVEAMKEILREIKKKNAGCSQVTFHDIHIGLQGDFQKVNAAAAGIAAKILDQKYGFPVSEAAIEKGWKASDWPGRLELISKKPDILLDGAHNPVSIEALVRNLKRLYPGRDRVLVFGTSRDKRLEEMLRILAGYFDKIILAPLPNPRSQEIGTLLLQARHRFPTVFAAGDIAGALELAKKVSEKKSLIVFTGSFYLIGEARRIIRAGN